MIYYYKVVIVLFSYDNLNEVKTIGFKSLKSNFDELEFLNDWLITYRFPAYRSVLEFEKVNIYGHSI